MEFSFYLENVVEFTQHDKHTSFILLLVYFKDTLFSGIKLISIMRIEFILVSKSFDFMFCSQRKMDVIHQLFAKNMHNGKVINNSI